MVIFDGFIAGVVCGVSGFAILLIFLTYRIYRYEMKAKLEVSKFLNNLDDAAKTVIVKGDNNTDDSND